MFRKATSLSEPPYGVAGSYPVGYTRRVIEIRQTDEYSRRFESLLDHQTRVRILARIRRLSLVNPGDVRPVGEGVSELRVDCGPGFRIYFKRCGNVLVILLAGGNKKTQERDIEKARKLARGR
jgi:putative addiction module killer protein